MKSNQAFMALTLHCECLARNIAAEDRLTPEAFFQAARQTAWGSKACPDDMVESYNRALGRLFVRGELEPDELFEAQGITRSDVAVALGIPADEVDAAVRKGGAS